jgi:hypothetical protein
MSDPPHLLFRPENALEEALVTARQVDDVEALLVALAEADVFVPSPDAGLREEQPVLAKLGDTLALPVVELGGDRFVPVFSSLRQLGLARPVGGGYLRFLGRSLAEIWPAGVSLVLNPGGELGLVLGAEQVVGVRDLPPPAEDEASFMIGEPAMEPVEVLAAISEFAKRRPEVLAAYRGLFVRSPGFAPEPVVGLELAREADREAIIGAAAEAAREAGIDALALLTLDAGEDGGPVPRFLLERTQPFYRRLA